jgi:hypothetical protein
MCRASFRSVALPALFCAIAGAQQPAAEGSRIKAGPLVEAAAIVSMVPPVYPRLAESGNVEGVVHLAAIIGPEGTVQELHALGGPALLFQAAIDAVKQWVYRPFLLNGQAVSVETTIDVDFALHHPPRANEVPMFRPRSSQAVGIQEIVPGQGAVEVDNRGAPGDLSAGAFFLLHNDEVTALLAEWRYSAGLTPFRAIQSWGYLDFSRGVPFSSGGTIVDPAPRVGFRKL